MCYFYKFPVNKEDMNSLRQIRKILLNRIFAKIHPNNLPQYNYNMIFFFFIRIKKTFLTSFISFGSRSRINSRKESCFIFFLSSFLLNCRFVKKRNCLITMGRFMNQ